MIIGTEFMGMKLKNPVIVASGPWSRDGAAIQRSVDAGAAAVITETITLEANPILHPRIYWNSGRQLFNTKLFSDLHLEQWEQEFENLRLGDCKLIASIWGNSPSELSYLAAKVERMGVDAIEISISAPLGTRSTTINSYPQEIFEFVHAVTEAVDIPVMVKLSYEAANSGSFTRSLEQAGAKSVSAIDSLKGLMGVDLDKRCALMPTYGGYSGQQIRPIALATTATLKQITALPVCGCGGIEDANSALEFIMMGAECIQLASAVMREGYTVITKTIADMESWMQQHHCSSLREIRGAALDSLRPFEDVQPQPITAKLLSPCVSECDLCRKGCLYQAITRTESGIMIDRQKCTGCGFCTARCPEKKIQLDW